MADQFNINNRPSKMRLVWIPVHLRQVSIFHLVSGE
jgi:hypothetical protein